MFKMYYIEIIKLKKSITLLIFSPHEFLKENLRKVLISDKETLKK